MSEHHKEQEIYFGEDYYDENMEDSDEFEIQDDPYAEAERLARIAAKNQMKNRTDYLDEQNIITDHHLHSRDDSQRSESVQHHRHQADPTHTHNQRRSRHTESSQEVRSETAGG